MLNVEPLSPPSYIVAVFPPEESRVIEVIARGVNSRWIISPTDYGVEWVLVTPKKYESRLWGSKVCRYARVGLVVLVYLVLIRAVSGACGGCRYG